MCEDKILVQGRLSHIKKYNYTYSWPASPLFLKHNVNYVNYVKRLLYLAG